MRKKKLMGMVLAGVLGMSMNYPVFGAQIPEGAEQEILTEETGGEVEVYSESSGNETLSGTGEGETESDAGLTQEENQDKPDEEPQDKALASFGDGTKEQTELFSSGEGGTEETFSSGEDTENEGTEGLEYEYMEETDSYRVVKGVDKEQIKIPGTYQGKPVTEIGEAAFAGYTNVVSVSAFTGLKIGTIRERAFENCANLRSVSIGTGVTIESNAFRGCHKLADLYAEQKEGATIAYDAFDPDSKVLVSGIVPPSGSDFPYPFLSVSWEDGLLFYEDGATLLEGSYEGMTAGSGDWGSLDTAIIDYSGEKEVVDLTEDGLKGCSIIGRKAFYGCSEIKTVIVSDATKLIDIKAFAECTNLEKIYIPADVQVIAEDAFDNCPNVVLYVEEGSYAQEYARAHNLPFVSEAFAPEIKKVTVYKNMITVEFSPFKGDAYYCVLGTENKNGVPVRSGKNGRIAIGQTGNKVVFRNVNKGTYYIGARALSVAGNKKNYSEWSDVIQATVKVDTPARPSIRSVTQSGRNLRVTVNVPKGADEYSVVLAKGTKKNDSSTAAVPVPAKEVTSVWDKADNTTVVLKKVQPGRYYLGVRAYKKDNYRNIYSQWSPLKKITVK